MRIWAAAIVLAATVIGASSPATADDPSGRVLVVSIPATTWRTYVDGPAPQIRRFAASAAVASLGVRTADPLDTAAAAYLSIGAGRRAGVGGATDAGVAVQSPDGSIISTNFTAQTTLNDASRFGAVVGSLGGAIRSAGRDTAVIGDSGTIGSTAGRSAALATADRSGVTASGQVDGLLVEDPGAPGGARLDVDRVVTATSESLRRSALVVVELSDVERAITADADDLAPAVAATDTAFGRLVSLVDPSVDTVIVVSPTTPGEDRSLGVFALQRPDSSGGLARSATTRRDGYVTIEDIGSTVLAALELPVPEEMGDTPVSVTSAPGGDEGGAVRLESLVDAASAAAERDRTVGPLGVALALLAVASGAAGVLVLVRRRTAGPWLRWLAATTVAVPGMAFLTGVWPGAEAGPAVVVAVTLVAAAATGCTSVALSERRNPSSAVLLPAGVTVAILLIDIAAGGSLQIDTPLGYSATVGGRFSGFGNQASGYLSASTLVALCGLWALAERRGVQRRIRLAAAGALIGVVAVVTALPTLGADVGGTLAIAAGGAVAVVVLATPGVSPTRLVAVVTATVVAVVVILAGLGVWDSTRPVGSRTHLGRFTTSVLEGEAGRVVARRWDAAAEVFWSTPWTLAVPALLVALASLAWRRHGRAWAVVRTHPELAALGSSTAVAGAVGWLVNDSGVAVAACVIAVAVPAVAAVATAPSSLAPSAESTGERADRVAVP
ncbi:MAG: hypothetical protein FJW94_07940 [Actinobacteria bacterium]|nr:hypothetical protein [Actinomycetota bacterium]